LKQLLYVCLNCRRESVVERTIKTNSLLEVFLRTKGYSVNYLYGGDSFLITWKIFLAVTDIKLSIKTLQPAEITFLMFGVCDEDMANKGYKP
jgi:hypothetical protein